MRSLLVVLFALCCAVSVCCAGTCLIDGGSKQQIIDGYGFSTAWSGKLSDAKNNALYNTLGMSLLRIRIDENGYFTDEKANAKAAHAAGARVFGSSWTAPPKWNSNGQSTKGYLLEKFYPDFAQYLAGAVKTIGVDWVSFINEPDFGGGNGDYMTEPNMRLFLKTYGRQLGKPILYPEAFAFDDKWSDPALNDPDAAALISIVAGHIYGGGNRVHQNALNKGKHVWETENYLSGANDINTCTDLAMQIGQLMNNQFSAYCWWWVNDNAPNENLVKQSGEINLLGYTIGQYAKFVRPGYQRVASTFQPANNLYITAYTGGEFVIVAVNRGGATTQSFSVKNVPGLSSTLTIHRTDSGAKLSNVGSVTVSASGDFSLNLPGNSITTIHGAMTSDWKPIPVPPPDPVTCDFVNEGSSLSLNCPAGQTIASIDFASYGTPSGDCVQGFSKSSCESSSSKSVVSTQCVGKNACSVSADNGVFGDPCSGTQKRLAVKVSCSTAPLPSDVTCASATEFTSLTLGCSGTKKISAVTFASYGLPSGDCPSPAVNSTCNSSQSKAVVEGACLGKTSCTVAASNDLFTDPCSGILKKLTAAITCA